MYVPMLNVVMDIEHVCGESVVQVEGSEINNLDPLSKTENKTNLFHSPPSSTSTSRHQRNNKKSKVS
jgi:hypothetical protein